MRTSCCQYEHSGFEGEKMSGQMKSEKLSGLMIGKNSQVNPNCISLALK